MISTIDRWWHRPLAVAANKIPGNRWTAPPEGAYVSKADPPGHLGSGLLYTWKPSNVFVALSRLARNFLADTQARGEGTNEIPSPD